MNELLFILGAAAVGYYLLNKDSSTDKYSENNGQSNNANNKPYYPGQGVEVYDDTESKQNILICKPALEISRANSTGLWTGRYSVTIKNISKNTTVTIVNVRSVISMYSSVVTGWEPANEKIFARLLPGDEVTVSSTWQDKKFFIDSDVMKSVLNKLNTYSSGKGQLLADVSVAVMSNYGFNNQIDMINVSGDVTQVSFHYYANEGEDGRTWNGAYPPA